MRVWKTVRIALIAILSCPATGQVFGKYSGGEGNLAKPWEIGSEADLFTLANSLEDWGGVFVLERNITMGRSWTAPIGLPSTPFTGSFDGKGRTLFSLRVQIDAETSPATGLFGVLGTNGSIRDLNLGNPLVTGCVDQEVGALVGRVTADSNDWVAVSGCHVECGAGSGVFAGTSSYAGGLAGRVLCGTILRCSMAGGNVQSGGIAGGLVGSNKGIVSECGARFGPSEVAIQGPFCGGLVGQNEPRATIERCYAKDLLMGGSVNCGGLVGFNDAGASIVNSCARDVQISPAAWTAYAGGLVGTNYGHVYCCYASRIPTEPVIGYGAIGNDDTPMPTVAYTGSFWDAGLWWSADGAPGPRPGLCGAETSQMKQPGLYVDAGWDFQGESKNGTDETWWIVHPGEFPTLKWEYAALTADLWALTPDSYSRRTVAEIDEAYFYVALPTDVTPLPSRSLDEDSLKLEVLDREYPLVVDYRWPHRCVRLRWCDFDDAKEVAELAEECNPRREEVCITGQFLDGSGFVARGELVLGGFVPVIAIFGDWLQNNIEASFRDRAE